MSIVHSRTTARLPGQIGYNPNEGNVVYLSPRIQLFAHPAADLERGVLLDIDQASEDPQAEALVRVIALIFQPRPCDRVQNIHTNA
jgi:hypothetical protein